MTTTSAKITKKGQVTIPKAIRDILDTDIVYFEVVNDTIVVRAVKDAGGSLSEYAKNVKRGALMKKMKARAWKEAVIEKSSKKSS